MDDYSVMCPYYCSKCDFISQYCKCGDEENMNEPATVTLADPSMSAIYFNPTGKEWAIKLTTEGFEFNRECYPNATPDDFAKCFIDILEKYYTIKFERNKPPYDRKHDDQITLTDPISSDISME